MDAKQCARCEELKPLTSFHKSKAGRDGYHYYCKACISTYQEEYRARKRAAKPPKPPRTAKVCRRCQIEKPVDEFPWLTKKGRQPYLGAWCHSCIKEYKDTLYRSTHPDRTPKVTSKTCAICEKHLPSTDFLLTLNTEDNLSFDCRKCRLKQNKARWLAKNPYFCRQHTMKALARKKGLVVDDDVDYHAILERDGYTCHICGDPVPPDDVEFDHVIPLDRGGPHTMANIRVSHATCNRHKHNKILPKDEALYIG